MEINSKGLFIYVDSVVSNFAYEDFQPSSDNGKLRRKVEEIIALETPYWKPNGLNPSLQRDWFSIEVRTFENEDPLYIGINVGKRSIKIIGFKEISFGKFQAEFYNEDVLIKDIWLDHSILSKALSGVVSHCIEIK